MEYVKKEMIILYIALAAILACIAVIAIFKLFNSQNYNGVKSWQKLIFIFLILAIMIKSLEVFYYYNAVINTKQYIYQIQHSNLYNKDNLIQKQIKIRTNMENGMRDTTLEGYGIFGVSLLVMFYFRKVSNKAYDKVKNKWKWSNLHS